MSVVYRYLIVALALLGMSACSRFTVTAAANDPGAPLSLDEMLSCVARPTPLPAPVVANRAVELEARLAEAGARGRFRLACLIGHEGASDTQLARAQVLLKGLERDLKVDGGAEVVALYRRHLTLLQHLREQRRQAREYQSKIEQLKGLERELEAVPAGPEVRP